jgi:CRISPR/Cas system-associated exonuclease Cas4 (RecB family)
MPVYIPFQEDSRPIGCGLLVVEGMAIGVLAGWKVGSPVHSVEHPLAGDAVAVAIGIAVC